MPSSPPVPLTSPTHDAGSPDVVLVGAPHDPAHLAAVVARLADAAGMGVQRVDVREWRGAAPGPAAAVSVLTPGAVEALAGADAATAPAWARERGGRRLVVADDPDDPALLHRSLALGCRQVVAVTDELRLLACVRAARDEAVTAARRRGRVVGVRSVTGGAGASSLAAALALQLGPDAVLVDADTVGAGVEPLLGDRWSVAGPATGGRDEAADVPGWARLGDLDGQVDPTVLLARLPVDGGLRVVGHGRGVRVEPPAARVALVVDAASRAGSTVVVDLPRRTPGSPACDEEVLVVPCTLPGVDAAFREVAAGAEAAGEPERPARRWLVARRARTGLHPVEVADALGVALLAQVAHDRRVDEHVALGLGVAPRRRSAWARAARACVAGLDLDRTGGARWAP